jgi:predicted GNAT family acetyltransferase
MSVEYNHNPELSEANQEPIVELRVFNSVYSDQGHVMYDVFDKDGYKIGNIDFSFYPKEKVAVIANTEIKYSLRGKGYGKAMYKKAITIAREKGLKLRSSDYLSKDAANVWESLIKEGLATKFANNYYSND